MPSIEGQAQACRLSIEKCLQAPELVSWAQNRLIDFNLWASGVGVFGRGKNALSRRLHEVPEVEPAIISLLEILSSTFDRCFELGKLPYLLNNVRLFVISEQTSFTTRRQPTKLLRGK